MKLTIVGGGNGGIFTALHFALYTKLYTRTFEDIEIELIYDPDTPVEKVGQATLTPVPELLQHTIGFNWYHNNINATMKSGILYEGWGKANDEVFHDFAADQMAMHYCPWEMQKAVLNSGWFKVKEGRVDPKEVDADYVFDCRGKPKDFSDYEELKNPTNACILGRPKWDTTLAPYSRHVATPHGWTFVIPTHVDSPSHDYCVGYCYNSRISSKKDAENNFLEMFDVDITKHLNYRNYVAKKPVIDGRIILNGNRLFFLDPLESSSTHTYLQWCRILFDVIITKRYVKEPYRGEEGNILDPNKFTMQNAIKDIRTYITQINNFVLWHYQFGSKYDTRFWRHAKRISKFKDPLFDEYLNGVKSIEHYTQFPEGLNYGQWALYGLRVWHEGMTKVGFKHLSQ